MKYLFWGYCAFIVALCMAPLGGAGLNSVTVLSLRADYLAHGVLFLPWAFLGLAVKWSGARSVLWGVLFAAGCEAVHYVLPYRTFNVNDLFANVLGVVAGCIVYIPWIRSRLFS